MSDAAIDIASSDIGVIWLFGEDATDSWGYLPNYTFQLAALHLELFIDSFVMYPLGMCLSKRVVTYRFLTFKRSSLLPLH